MVLDFFAYKKILSRTEMQTRDATRRYGQFEISPEAIEQELRPADCERRQI